MAYLAMAFPSEQLAFAFEPQAVVMLSNQSTNSSANHIALMRSSGTIRRRFALL